MKPANFITRTLTAIFFAVLMIGSVLAGSHYFAALMLVVFILGSLEFYNLVSKNIGIWSKFTGILSGAIIFAIVFLVNTDTIPGKFAWSLPVLLFAPVIFTLFKKENNSQNAIGTSLTAIVLLAVPLSLFASIMLLGSKLNKLEGNELIIIYLIILWVFDSTAYIIGSLIGRRKLFERISPSKTWEGTIGGLICSMGIAWGVSLYFVEIALWHWMSITLLIVVFGTIGDLAESMLKRKAGVKDSGTLLPGHGGILDRFDAVLISAPAVYLYLIIILN